MGLKTDNSHVDVQLSKMEAAIENIVSLTFDGNLAVNQLMECEVATVIIAKAMSTEEPKWTIMMAKNMPRWLARLWRHWLTHPNKRSANSTYASRALKQKKVRLTRSWCSSST
jgi:hypothetical protein